jgi:hypothetical protein
MLEYCIIFYSLRNILNITPSSAHFLLLDRSRKDPLPSQRLMEILQSFCDVIQLDMSSACVFWLLSVFSKFVHANRENPIKNNFFSNKNSSH